MAMPASSSARSTPICAQPRAAPPPSASAMPCGLCGLGSTIFGGSSGSLVRALSGDENCSISRASGLLRMDAQSSIAIPFHPSSFIEESRIERMKMGGFRIPNGSLLLSGGIARASAVVGYEADLAVCHHDLPIEAGTPAGVASCTLAGHVYAQRDGVLVTIREDLDHVLDVSRGLSLLPQ